jgi:hypothetical protein
LTLIAKSLQGLANMTTFGSKELWMEPMNSFLSSHRGQFKSFLDTICSVSSSSVPLVLIPPSYSTPLAILTRLPPTSSEGFPSLPYLIDHAKSFAALVSLWLDYAGNVSGIQEGDGDLLKFHQLVVSLRKRTEQCLAGAERAERPSSSHSFQWEELVEQLENTSTHVGPRSLPHSRMASNATSIAPTSDPGSPTPGRGVSFDMPPVEATKTQAKTSKHQPTSNSPTASKRTSPYPMSDTQLGDVDDGADQATTPHSASDDAPVSGYASISAQKVPRTMYGYGYTEGWAKNREALRIRERESSRQHSQQKQQRRDHSGVRSSMPSSSISPTDISPTTMPSSPFRDERSWLGDKASTSGEDDKSSGWSGERAYKSEGEPNNGFANGRPTRRLDSHDRQAALQQEAEQMEPGEARDRKPTREPRRDWAAEERQKRTERTDIISTGNGRDGSFIFGSHRHQESRSHPNSTPGSRHQSRQPSISSEETDEGTTALPKMVKEEMRDSEAKDGKEKEKPLFERIGFKKRKG